MFIVSGTVSSKMFRAFFSSSMMTMSGLRLVTQRSAGMVPPPADSQPEHFELWVHTVCNIVDEVVVSPCVALCVKHNLAAVQIVVCGAPVSTELAFV